jgi:hypothetical protein
MVCNKKRKFFFKIFNPPCSNLALATPLLQIWSSHEKFFFGLNYTEMIQKSFLSNKKQKKIFLEIFDPPLGKNLTPPLKI